MKKSLVTLTALVAAAFVAQGAIAAEGTKNPDSAASTKPASTKARPEVKSEAAAANKTDMVVKGEGMKSNAASAASTKTRADRKSEAAAANKTDMNAKGGEGTKNPDSNSGTKK